MITATPRTIRFTAVILSVLMLFGCTVKYVADYDSTTFNQIFDTAKKVDLFYGNLLESPKNSRAYSKFSGQYVDIEVDIRALVSRNKARPLNTESTRISEIILSKWVKYKDKHKEKETYSDGNAKLDRNRFERLFRAAADAESAKKLTDDEKADSQTGNE